MATAPAGKRAADAAWIAPVSNRESIHPGVALTVVSSQAMRAAARGMPACNMACSITNRPLRAGAEAGATNAPCTLSRA